MNCQKARVQTDWRRIASHAQTRFTSRRTQVCFMQRLRSARLCLSTARSQRSSPPFQALHAAYHADEHGDQLTCAARWRRVRGICPTLQSAAVHVDTMNSTTRVSIPAGIHSTMVSIQKQAPGHAYPVTEPKYPGMAHGLKCDQASGHRGGSILGPTSHYPREQQCCGLVFRLCCKFGRNNGHALCGQWYGCIDETYTAVSCF